MSPPLLIIFVLLNLNFFLTGFFNARAGGGSAFVSFWFPPKTAVPTFHVDGDKERQDEETFRRMGLVTPMFAEPRDYIHNFIIQNLYN